MNAGYWKFAACGELVFGRGALEAIGPQCVRRGCRRPLVITDPNLAALGLVDRIVAICRQHGLECSVFAGGEAEPAVTIAEDAASSSLSFAPDCVIGLGGGSNMDVAKATSLLLRHGGKMQDYFGFDRVPGPVLPLFAVPTTAGTGSEVSHSSVLTDKAAQIKVSTLSPFLRPTVAIVDPSLTDSCPASVTAHSGIDALVHAIEGVTARHWTDMIHADPQARAYEGAHPLGQMLGMEAIRMIGKFLPKAVANPKDQEARDNMALAATYAGMSFSNCGVALVHALEYPLGASVHCSHGEGNGLLLPHVMRYNLHSRINEFAAIANALGAIPHKGTHETSLTLEEQANEAVAFVERLQSTIGIRKNLRSLGVIESTLPAMAHKSFQIKRLMELNPRRPSEADLLAILQAAY